MILEDFKYMWCGKDIKSLHESDANLLKSVGIFNKQHGKALLLLHGFTSSPAVYREIIPYLNFYDAIYCPVLPGHGKSVDIFSKATAEQWLNFSYDAYLNLAANYKSIDVMGLSLGGILALNLCHKFPVNHLYLLAPALKLRWVLNALLFSAFFLRFMGFKKIRNRGGNLLSHKFQEIVYKELPLSSIIEILSLIKNNSFKLPDCPTDIFLGRFDKVVDSSGVADLFVNAVFVNIHWLENSAHVLPLDGDADKIIQIVRGNI